MNMRPNWQADCPRCVAGKFTCDEHYRPEIECRECNGEGFVRTNGWPFGPTCTACEGEGWRPMNDDELADAAERQAEDAAGEPPITMDEQHRAAWQQKQELWS